MPSIDRLDGNFGNFPRDDRFLRKLREIVESNLEDEHFSVQKLAQIMAMSRIQLYRRIHQLSGKSVSHYIRDIRLEKAMEMLKMDIANVSEIAYRVGFSNPAYFIKCFRKRYGFSPGNVLKGEVPEDVRVLKKTAGFKEKVAMKRQNILYWLMGIAVFIMLTLVVWYFPVMWQARQLLESNAVDLTVMEKSIAVLPFRNESPDQENEYFCNGMQDEILNHLQKIADLSVRSRTSVEQYRDSNKDMRAIGRELNTAYVLEGSVRKREGQLRMSAQLIDTRTDEHLWGETYDVTYSDTVFAIQTYIAKRIATSLQAILTPMEEQRIRIRYTDNINSYDYAIRAKQEMANFWKYSDKKHIEAALELYQTSLDFDPENVTALVGKGNVYLYKQHPDSTLFYCNQAIGIDPTIADAYHVKAAYYTRGEKYDSAIVLYLETIELAPNDAMAHAQLGQIYVNQKKDVIKGMKHLNKALELNVYGQPYIFYWVGMCLLHVGDYERADRYLRKEIVINLNCLTVERYSWCLAVMRKHEEASVFLDSICGKVDCERVCIRENWYQSYCRKDYERAGRYLREYTEKGYELEVHWKIVLADMYLQMGTEEEALQLLEECRSYFERSMEWWGEIWYNTFNLSHIYAMLGEKEKGLKYLSKAVDIGILGGWQDLMEVHTVYENLWDEPEFKELVKRSKAERAALRDQIRNMEKHGEINL